MDPAARGRALRAWNPDDGLEQRGSELKESAAFDLRDIDPSVVVDLNQQVVRRVADPNHSWVGVSRPEPDSPRPDAWLRAYANHEDDLTVLLEADLRGGILAERSW